MNLFHYSKGCKVYWQFMIYKRAVDVHRCWEPRLPAEERGSRARDSSAYRTWQQERGTTWNWSVFRGKGQVDGWWISYKDLLTLSLKIWNGVRLEVCEIMWKHLLNRMVCVGAWVWDNDGDWLGQLWTITGGLGDHGYLEDTDLVNLGLAFPDRESLISEKLFFLLGVNSKSLENRNNTLNIEPSL